MFSSLVCWSKSQDPARCCSACGLHQFTLKGPASDASGDLWLLASYRKRPFASDSSHVLKAGGRRAKNSPTGTAHLS